MRVATCLVVLILAGCRDEPSFNERYANTIDNLEGQANEMDRQLDNSAGESTEPRSAEQSAR
jgi:hypothetical protein